MSFCLHRGKNNCYLPPPPPPSRNIVNYFTLTEVLNLPPYSSHRNFACVKTPLFKSFLKWPNMVNFTTEKTKPIVFEFDRLFLMLMVMCLAAHSTRNYNLVRRQRKQIMNSRSFNPDYYSFKMFPRFWLAKSTRLIHHKQLRMTKFGRILCLARKWRQKCSVLAV